jgi:hypothetical protein
MSYYAAGGLSTAGSTTLPVFALVGAATVRCRILEIGVFNTTATAVALKLVRLTTAGTPGTAVTVDKMGPEDPAAAVGVARNTYTVTATMTDAGFRTVLGAAVGSGFVWTFADYEFTTLVAANAAIACVVENGTGQPVQWYVKWKE